MTSQEVVLEEHATEFRKIIELLKDLQIRNVVSIDDEWNISNKLEFYNKTTIQSFCETFQVEITEYEAIDISNAGDILTIEQLMSTSIEDLKSLKTRIQGVFESVAVEPTLDSLSSLLNAMSKEVNIFQHSNISNQVFEDLKGRTLFIIDRNMEKVHGSKDALVDFIYSINKGRAIENLDIIIVYSGEDNSDYRSFDTKVSYIDSKLKAGSSFSAVDPEETAGLMAYQLWAIDKTSNEEVLKVKLLETITQSFLGHSIYYYLRNQLEVKKKIAKKIIYQAKENMEDLSLAALIEGEHFVESFNRASECLLNEDFYSNETSHAIIKNIIIAEKKASLKLVSAEGSWQSKKRARLNKIKSDANYLSVAKHGIVDYMINKLYRDIATGDILQFEYIASDFTLVAALGIVVTPECDCIVRGEPAKRKEKDFKIVILNKKLLSTLTPKQLAESESTIWPINIDDDYYLLEFTKKSITIDARILDLCSLNKDGIAIYDYGDITEALRFKTHYSDAYFKRELPLWKSQLQQYIIKKHEVMIGRTLVAAASEKEIVTSSINEPFMYTVISDIYKIIFTKIEDQGGFNIRRLGRLESRRTLEIIQEVTNHSGRTGSEPNATLW